MRGVVVVTGANGFIGRHLAEHLTANGWEVRPAVRPTWELGQPLGDLLHDADVVIHTALTSYTAPDAHRRNVDGSRLLIDEVRSHPPTRMILMSSVAARPNARSSYGRDKFALQSMLTGPRELAIRPGLVLGDGGLFYRIRSMLRRGPIVPLVDGGRQLVQTVHIDDLVAAMSVLIDEGTSGTVTIAERTPVRFSELLRETARQMRRRVLFLPVPAAVLDLALMSAEKLGVSLPVSRDNLVGLQTSTIAEPDEIPSVHIRDYRASLESLIEAA